MVANLYSTLSEATNSLKEKGFILDFKAIKEGLLCIQTKRLFRPEDLKIVEFHRFEGDSSTDDMDIIYAIEAQTGEKGTIVDAFGTYANEHLTEQLKKIKINK